MFRVQNNVPEVYVNESRDFQLLCRSLDSINSGVRYDVNSMKYITDTAHCNSRLLQLLQTKLGFFTNENIIDEDLRQILLAFPYIENNKGSILAIKQALYLFMKINSMRTSIYITIKTGEIIVGIKSDIKNTKILQEIFRYIVPTGYIIKYQFYTSSDTLSKFNLDEDTYIFELEGAEEDSITIRKASTLNNYEEQSPDERIISAIDSVRLQPNNKDGEQNE